MRGDLVLGVDFGTSYSSAAAVVEGRIQFALGDREPQMPSVAYVPERGELIVGAEAARLGLGDPCATLSGIKRIVGRAFTDEAIRRVDAGVGYQIRPGPGQMPLVYIKGSELAPAQVVAAILGRLKGAAERRFDTRVSRAVMTVPVSATPAYSEAVRRAAAMVGLAIEQLVAEPIAGMLSYGLQTDPGTRRLAVCDFGGGTFDATLVEQSGVTMTPVATGGDMFLGGEDFDVELARAVSGSVYRRAGVDLGHDAAKWSSLLWRCESTKQWLSREPRARLLLRRAFARGGAWRDADLVVEREWIEPRWEPLVQRACGVLHALLRSAGWAARDVDRVVLIGGTTLIPLVRDRLSRFFGTRAIASAGADSAVVRGAAAAAARLMGAVPERAEPAAI